MISNVIIYTVSSEEMILWIKNYWIGGFLLVIVSLILNGCGNEEKTNSTKNLALSTYVDEF